MTNYTSLVSFGSSTNLTSYKKAGGVQYTHDSTAYKNFSGIMYGWSLAAQSINWNNTVLIAEPKMAIFDTQSPYTLMVDNFTLINNTFTAAGWDCSGTTCVSSSNCSITNITNTLNIGIDDYFYRLTTAGYTMDNADGKCALSIVGGADSGYMVFGTQFMANYWIQFDYINNQITMAQSGRNGTFTESTLTPAYFTTNLTFSNSTFLWTGGYTIGQNVTETKQLFNTRISGVVYPVDSKYNSSTSNTS